VSSYEVAEVFGTAFFVLLCQGFAVGALLYAGLRSSHDNKWMVSTSEMTLMRFVTTTILHFHLTPVVTARLQLLKFVTYNP
jgi:glycerol uptake facilitator-like aquaporin